MGAGGFLASFNFVPRYYEQEQIPMLKVGKISSFVHFTWPQSCEKTIDNCANETFLTDVEFWTNLSDYFCQIPEENLTLSQPPEFQSESMCVQQKFVLKGLIFRL